MSTTLTGAVGTLPLANTATVPVPSELVQAANVQVIAQALLDQDATLEDFAVIDLAGRPGGNTRTVRFNLGITVLDGVLTDAVILPVSGSPKVRINPTNAGEIESLSVYLPNASAPKIVLDSSGNGNVKLLSRKRLRRARVPLSDANHTIDVTQGDRFELTEAPALIRTITLDSTTGSPQPDETIEFIVRKAIASGQAYIFKNSAGATIAEIWGAGAGDAGAYVAFDFHSGTGHFTIGANSGGGNGEGVLPGPGA